MLDLGTSFLASVERDPDALAIVDTFLEPPMREARYIRRLAKIRDIEQRRLS